jgi:hypothetical protein
VSEELQTERLLPHVLRMPAEGVRRLRLIFQAGREPRRGESLPFIVPLGLLSS